MVHEVSCITSLNLSLGNQDFPRNHLSSLHDHHQDQDQEHPQPQKTISSMKLDQSLPSLTLGLARDQESDQDPIKLTRQASNSIVSAISSFSNSTSVKRERDAGGEEVEKVSSKAISNEGEQDEFEGGSRKKLRLTKEQSFVLEECFKQHSTLNPKQKQTLAKSLNLQPRQVEVWFQNRRARTKLKQNEVDCALLKKCCEALTNDNRRLKREIQELKAIKTNAIPSQFYMQFPTTTHNMCRSCEGVISVNGVKNSVLPPTKVSPF